MRVQAALSQQEAHRVSVRPTSSSTSASTERGGVEGGGKGHTLGQRLWGEPRLGASRPMSRTACCRWSDEPTCSRLGGIPVLKCVHAVVAANHVRLLVGASSSPWWRLPTGDLLDHLHFAVAGWRTAGLGMTESAAASSAEMRRVSVEVQHLVGPCSRGHRLCASHRLDAGEPRRSL